MLSPAELIPEEILTHISSEQLSSETLFCVSQNPSAEQCQCAEPACIVVCLGMYKFRK